MTDTEDMEVVIDDVPVALCEDREDAARIGSQWQRYRPTAATGFADSDGLLFASISAMPAYGSKSHEELRYEDLLLEQDCENAGERLKPWQPSKSVMHSAAIDRNPRYSRTYIGDPDALCRTCAKMTTLLRFGQLPPPARSDFGYLVSITAMERFADVSLEELRCQDHNSPATWKAVMLSKLKPYRRPPIELLIREAVGSIIHLAESYQSPSQRNAHVDAANEQWCRALLDQTLASCRLRDDRFVAILASQTHGMAAGGGELGPPVSLDWINRGDIVRGAPWGEQKLKHVDLYDSIDSFLFVTFYCVMSIVQKPLLQRKLDASSSDELFMTVWRSAFDENASGAYSDKALCLFNKLRYLPVNNVEDEDGSLDSRTQATVADALGVLELRPLILQWLRVHAQRMEQYLEACKACVQAAVAHWDENDRGGSASSHSVEFVEIVRGDTAWSDAVSGATAYVKETATRGQDWLPRTSPNDPCVTRLVDPSLNCVTLDLTRRVLCFTDLKHTRPDPYKQMSRIAFQDSTLIHGQFYDSYSLFPPVREQWLPSDVHVDSEGRIKFASYINNLHPLSCERLYASLEKVLERMLPAFERVLGDLRVGSSDSTAWFSPSLPANAYIKQCLDQRPLPHGQAFALRHRPVWSLKNSRLQIVIGIDEIEIGRRDHVLNLMDFDEVFGLSPIDVVAGGVYCYEAHGDMMHSEVSFFCVTQRATSFGQGTNRTRVGSIPLRLGEALVWPSMYTTTLNSINSGSGSGSAKIVRFYLLAPDAPVISTTEVPQQHLRWFTESTVELANRFRLPHIATELILDFAQWRT